MPCAILAFFSCNLLVSQWAEQVENPGCGWNHCGFIPDRIKKASPGTCNSAQSVAGTRNAGRSPSWQKAHTGVTQSHSIDAKTKNANAGAFRTFSDISCTEGRAEGSDKQCTRRLRCQWRNHRSEE